MSASGGLTLTLVSNAVAYNLLALIQAVTGYANTHPTVRELTLVGGLGNAAAVVYVGGADVSTTNFGVSLIANQSTTYRSGLNDISMAEKWLISGGNDVDVNVSWLIY